MKKTINKLKSIVCVCLLILVACDNNIKKREAQRQEQLDQLVMQICKEKATELVIKEKSMYLQCQENSRSYNMEFNGIGYDITYNTKLPETILTYSKYGERILATVNGEWILDSQQPSKLDVYLHVVAGSKQDQHFDMVIDLRSKLIYRVDPISKQRGSELEFIASLQETLLTYASTAVMDASRPLLDRYGSLYQIQNILLEQDTSKLREDAYSLPFSIEQILYMQLPVEEENNLFYDRKNNYFVFDLRNQRVIVNTCKEGCDYQLTEYDLSQDVVVYYPNTDKEVVIDPDTCTTEKFCEVSKTIKASVISTLAFQSRVAPFRQAVNYNAQFTRGDIEELNKYLVEILKRYRI